MSGRYIPGNTNREEKGGETITELAHRHLKDRSHSTTDEELRNAKIELSEVVKLEKKNLFTIKSFIVNSLDKVDIRF